jgi:hypothetical protein
MNFGEPSMMKIFPDFPKLSRNLAIFRVRSDPKEYPIRVKLESDANKFKQC